MVYREEVWEPFVNSGLPTDQWHTIADKTTQLRPLAIGLGIQAFRRAIDEVVGKVAARGGREARLTGTSQAVVDPLVVRREEPRTHEPHRRHPDEAD